MIEVDGNAYSVLRRLIPGSSPGTESVRVRIAGGLLRVSHGGAEAAVHARPRGR